MSRITINPSKPKFLSREEAKKRMNIYGRSNTPYFFLISYDQQKNILFTKSQTSTSNHILFSFPKHISHTPIPEFGENIMLDLKPPSRKIYAQQFQAVQEEFQKGNIYLLNLTHSIPVSTKATLEEIYYHASAKYKVLFPGNFVVFSPETFVRIQDGNIFTYPMKGTIRADHPDALEKLRNNQKEQAEHASVVDLLRNDIGQVAKAVQVNRFRYFEKIKAGNYELWQASSEIKGNLYGDYLSNLGDLIFTLLPAGSITGVPKNNAVTVIRNVETHNREFYTGIAGYFDGKNLDSCVMIRFIEQTPEGLVYKSGGGIHQLSNMEQEYQELIEKIYVPVD